jgi:hypothetical protein
MRGFSLRSMGAWLRSSCSQSSILSMPAMSQRFISKRRNLTMEWICLAPLGSTHWYQAETGYDLTRFSIDREARTVTCPQGRISSSWTPLQDAGKSLIKVMFSLRDCKVCPSRPSCTGTTRRTLTLHPRERMQALLAARQRENTDAFKDRYRHRAGIEGIHSEASACDGLAALALYRSAQNPSGTCGRGFRYSCHSIDELASRRSTGTDPYLSFQTGHETGGLRWRL